MNHLVRAEKLATRLRKTLEKLEAQKLPGFTDFLRTNDKAYISFTEKFDGIERGLRDSDEILFEKSINGFENVCWAINQVLAETCRKNNPPEEWELRYIRFMKIKFIKFECDLGKFYLVPFTPRVKPRAPHWFTVDEMIDMMSNAATLIAIKLFTALPVRPESIRGPGPGEKDLLVDFTNGEMRARYELGKM